jgi:hypothetical protein
MAILYCDESGQTGENLLDLSQPFFSYAALRVDPLKATETANRLIKDYRIQGEIKSSNLLKYSKGRQAVTQILHEFHRDTKVVVHHKLFAATGKLFEYIFEPVLAKNSFLFYSIGFQKFFANLLYREVISKRPNAQRVIEDFQHAIRSKDHRRITGLFSPHEKTQEKVELAGLIAEFANLHSDHIQKEFESFADEPEKRWVLDLTSTSLDSLLAEWALDEPALEVICDDSKPLRVFVDIFNQLYYRAQDDSRPAVKRTIEINGRSVAMGAKLTQPLILAKSKDHFGLQFADIFAGSLVHCMSSVNSEERRAWMPMLIQSVHKTSNILPEDEHINFNAPEAKLNTAVLFELVRRSRNGESLLDGLGHFIGDVALRYGATIEPIRFVDPVPGGGGP